MQLFWPGLLLSQYLNRHLSISSPYLNLYFSRHLSLQFSRSGPI
jgi:hypothetical protein